jgi:hypothetical protein
MKTLIFTLIGLRKCCMKSQFFNRREQNSDQLFASVQVVHLCFKFCCTEYCKNDPFGSYDYLEFICFWPSKFKPSALKKISGPQQLWPGCRLGQSCLFFALHRGGGGGDPPVTLASRRWGPTYIASYTQYTGLLGLSPSWSFTVVNMVEGPVTTWAG